MCRFIGYIGEPILLDSLLYKPNHSLIHQSFRAKELEEPLNGDGFGIGWYKRELQREPSVFVSVQPAWSNRNLRYLSKMIQTDCLIAHVRAASEGETSEENCHPFHYKEYIMMHNGGVDQFKRIKRKLRTLLSDEMYLWIKGQTDSEHIFALFQTLLNKRTEPITPRLLSNVLNETFKLLRTLEKEEGLIEPSYCNMVITNGEIMIASRYCSFQENECLSLYYSKGGKYHCEEGICYMTHDENDLDAVMIVSEKLTDLEEDWIEVPDQHMVLVSNTQEITLIPIEF